MDATLANMRKVQDTGALAYSPVTGEEFSANPSDYFWLAENDVLQDSEGNPMILVRLISYLQKIEG